MLKDFLKGVQYFMEGFKLIFKPKIRYFIIVPLIMSTILILAIIGVFNHYINSFDQWVLAHLPHWLQWLGVVLHILLLTICVFVFMYISATITNLIAAPFNGLLSSKVEFFLKGKVTDNQSTWDFIKDIPRMIGRQFAIMGYYVPRALLLLVLFFVPVVQVIAAPLWFLFNAWFMALMYLDYPSDNQRVALDHVKTWIKERQFIAIGFGMMASLMMLIPILNLFVMPAAVAGATKFWLEE